MQIRLLHFLTFLTIFFISYPQLCLANDVPVGTFEAISGGAWAIGWAVDPDMPMDPIYVHFYVSVPEGSKKYIGKVLANMSRPDVNHATGFPGDHGFAWEIPEIYQNGYYETYGYAIDTEGGTNFKLTDSPKTPLPKPNATSEIVAEFDGDNVTIKTSERTAGAISSLTWRGMEFINSYDHGRELQSACSLDSYSECYNPTEAGSAADGKGNTTKSVLRFLEASENRLAAKTQMAFWLKPGQTSSYCTGATSAMNTVNVSDYVVSKEVAIGYEGIDNVIEYEITFTVPEARSYGVFEALTGYMPPEFSRFWKYDPETKRLYAISDGPGEQGYPLIFATPNATYAMGIFSPDLPAHQGAHLGYGRWRFPESQYPGAGNACVKWNCVFREYGLEKDDEFTYRCYPIIGSLNDVIVAMNKLYELFADEKGKSPIGYLDAINSAGLVSGWALDPDDHNEAITLEFYLDGPLGSGQKVGEVDTGLSRPDVNNATGYSGDHGFQFKLPENLKNSTHKLYVYGLDTDNSYRYELNNSGKEFTITISCPVLGVDSSGNCNLDCGSAKICIGKKPLDAISYCAYGGKPQIHDQCSETCQPEDRPDKICRKTGVSDCTAPAECDGLVANSCSGTALKKCGSSCTLVPSCGDGVCNCGETLMLCPSDCGGQNSSLQLMINEDCALNQPCTFITLGCSKSIIVLTNTEGSPIDVTKERIVYFENTPVTRSFTPTERGIVRVSLICLTGIPTAVKKYVTIAGGV
ncbi:MAG: hypothetical protein JW727_03820 [Candidatus Aenigmarchaeota archaeon]|nr:hypothetical protein [Candidatus Aenigmarchaeota archaeon]